MLSAQNRRLWGEPELLKPGRISGFAIDMWATADRYKTGHCPRLNTSSANFQRFDRNGNGGGEPADPIPAWQTGHHDPEHPSHLLVSVVGSDENV